MNDKISKNVFLGLLLILFGLAIILNNEGVVHIYWWSVLRMWPVFLIFWGIEVIPLNGWIKLGLKILVLAFVIYFIIKFPGENTWRESLHNI